MNPNESMNGDNPFAKVWSDWASQMMASGLAPPSGDMREAVARQMRQAYFDAWARHCEEFLGSEQFLETMKRSMDGALAFRQQLNEFMTKALHEVQAPARSDTDSILLVLHSLEDRVLGRIDELSRRVASLEQPAGEKGSAAESRSGTGPKGGRTGPSRVKGGAR